ncbi:MAG: TRAP transporter small permease [Synergistales bacterium]|jgi:TRAP-type C4-dicarboxylate transport system permease small subunit
MLSIFNKIEEKFLILNLLVSTIIVFLNVVLRYVFSASLSWVDEAARYMFLWLIWVGADYAMANRAHLRITMIPDRMHGKSRIRIECLVLAIWLCFCVFLGYQGVKLVTIVVAQQQLSTAMQINMGWAYACVPCGAIFMAIRIFLDILSVIRTGTIPGAGSNDPKKLAEEALEGVTM